MGIEDVHKRITILPRKCSCIFSQDNAFKKKSRYFAIGALLGGLAFLGAMVATTAMAQTAPEPGRIEKRFEKPIEPKSTLEPIVPEMEGPMPPEQAEKIKFTLTGLSIEGSTIYPETAFLPLYERYLGQEISLKTIYDVVGAITAKYGKGGYALSRAYVPAQKITNGIVRIGIIEGFIDKVIIEGDLNDKRGFFKNYESKILASRPLKTGVLERYLLLGNDLNGVSVKAVLKPSQETKGASNLILQVAKKIVDASVSFDNHGTKSSGPHQINLSGSINNIFGMFGRTTLGYIQTAQQRELKYFSLNHDEILNSEGTKLSFKAIRSLSTPGTRALLDLELKSKSNTLEVGISHPVIRSRSQNLTVKSSFEYKNTESFQLAERSSQDRIRSLRIGADYDYSDPWRGINLVSVEASHGLKIFHYTSRGYALLTRAGGRPDYTKVTINASRTQQLPNNFSVHVAAMGQRAAQKLLSSEECGVGGEQFGRAYDSSEITGDNCAAASAEVRYVPQLDIPNLKYLQLYGFYDIGGIWNINPAAGTPKKDTLASAGLGFRFGLKNNLSGALEVANPLTRPVFANNNTGDGGNSPRIFFRLTARY